MVKVAPSILSADFGNLVADIKTIENDIEMLHLDIMDGAFVPTITFGTPIIKALKKHFKIPLDVHLMVNEPLRIIEQYIELGCEYITIHYESTKDLIEALVKIRTKGVKCGLSIKPNTSILAVKDLLPYVDLMLVMSVEPGKSGQKFMPLAMDKIRELYQLREQYNYSYLISVDGGINDKTGPIVTSCGADIVVSGSYIFESENRQESIEKLRCELSL